MSRPKIARYVRASALGCVLLTLLTVALAIAPASQAQPVSAALLTTPTPTPTPSVTPTVTPTPTFPTQPLGSCALTVTTQAQSITVGDEVTFTATPTCGCVGCDFLFYELSAVESNGLFEPIAVPVGPPGPTEVTLTASAAGAGVVSMRWYGEILTPGPNGSTAYQWANLTGSIPVTVEPAISTSIQADCELVVTDDGSAMMVDEPVTFTLTPECVCEPLPTFDPTFECGFGAFQLSSVEPALFEVVGFVPGPAAQVEVVPASVYSGDLMFRLFGEFLTPSADGGEIFQQGYLSVTTQVDVAPQPDLIMQLVNENSADAYVPFTRDEQPVMFADLGSDAAGEIPAGTISRGFRVNRSGYSVQLMMAPGEQLSRLDCNANTTFNVSQSLSNDTLQNVVVLSGSQADVDEITCAFVTEQLTFGDVNCDERVSILDAAIIAEFSVGLRAEQAGCPTDPAAREINLLVADADGNKTVNVLDAYFVAQCSVGTPNVICPRAQLGQAGD